MEIFVMVIVRVTVILGDNLPVLSCPRWNYPGREFSLLGVFRVGIVQWESSG